MRQVTEYSSAKEIQQFSNCACYEKHLKENKKNQKYASIYICLLELRCRKSALFLEEVMSPDKYSSLKSIKYFG